jgi:hypothetical protein
MSTPEDRPRFRRTKMHPLFAVLYLSRDSDDAEDLPEEKRGRRRAPASRKRINRRVASPRQQTI